MGGEDQYCETDSSVPRIGGPNLCSAPGGVDYLNPVPLDPLTVGDHVYKWIDNSTDRSRFCVYTQSEVDIGVWFAGSHKGIRSNLTTNPAKVGLDCWQ